MAERISIADKETLDQTKELVQIIDEKCNEILQSGGGGTGGGLSLNSVTVYIADFVNDQIVITSGGLDEKRHIIKS